MSDELFKPPDKRRTIKIRIISRRSGQVRFGEPDEDKSWVATREEAVKVAKEVATRQTEDLQDLQIHIKNHKNGEVYVIFSDQATKL